jgi:RNA-directed DNA polymerase
MALKLVMEPIFESGFYASSYAYRPGRRTQDAIAETHHFTTRSYEWIVETDVEACFDRLSHCLILGEVRRRIADKRVLALVRLFLKAGLVSETGRLQRTVTGTPQGGIASPLLANIALSALDRQYLADWQEMSRYQGRRQYLQRTGHPTYRLVRYADDRAPRTLKEGRCRGRYRRMRCCTRDEGAGPIGLVALRGRPAGGDRKPPRGASVKSRGAERRGKGTP